MPDTEPELPERVETLIVGAGAVGCSIAYHLAERNVDDVAVVDAGPIPKTGGSSIHAPGGLFQTSGSKTMTKLAKYTRELYSDLDAFDTIGGIEIATTDERMTFLRRRMDQAKAWGLDGAELLTPEEVSERLPLVDPTAILGGYHMPTDGLMNSVDLLNELRTRAEDSGITFHEQTEVTDVNLTEGAVDTVVTDRGRIVADRVVIAGNIWAPLLGDMVGVDIPLSPCEHQYAVTESLDALAGAQEDVEQPFLRHQDAAMYFRQHRDGYGIGSYNHEPLLVDPEDIDSHDEAMEEAPVYDYVPGRGSNHEPVKMPSTRPFTEEHFEQAWRATVEILPELDGAEIARANNGMFCFTPDGYPVLGEAPQVDGFWVAAAVWLTHAGGVGKVMSELLTNGTAGMDISAAHISRFQPHETSKEYVRDRAYRQYDEVYDIVHPRESPTSLRELRTSPFYHQQSELDAEFYEADGWERPRWYGANESLVKRYDDRIPARSGWVGEHWSPIEAAEHLAVRDGVGMCDLSNFTSIDITGHDAMAFAQRMFTNDMDINVGEATYTTMVNEAGGIIGDMTVARLAENRFAVLTNSGSAGTEQLAWLRNHAPDDGSVTLTDDTSARCGVGVWGPDARRVLEPLVETDLSNDAFPYFSATETYLEGVPVKMLRVSYVGELGWELHAPAEYGTKLWNAVWEAGQKYDIVPMGDGALNTMRLEKGYPLYGADVHSEYNPYEANLGFAVDTDTEFVGRDALLDVAETGLDERLACLTFDQSNFVTTSGVPILDGDDRLGYATSADYGYSVGTGVLYGYLPMEYVEPGTDVQVQYENTLYDATVRESPLFDPDRTRLLQ